MATAYARGILARRDGVGKGRFPSGGLWGSLCSLLCALFSLCSLPSSLAAAHFSDRISHLPLRFLHPAIDVAPDCFDPLRLPPWPGGMREAIK